MRDLASHRVELGHVMPDGKCICLSPACSSLLISLGADNNYNSKSQEQEIARAPGFCFGVFATETGKPVARYLELLPSVCR